ncbi:MULTISPECIES: hypothetical protein [Luteimonas]|uniref:hypothetical protein n=1 Tax=Luteimonas TaxID=83614 RepID=UPI000C797998|nr:MULTISPECIES: hypothetical protein [Luteimonas]
MSPSAVAAHPVRRACRTALALALGFVAVVLVNLAGAWLASALGLADGGHRRLAWDLAIVCLAGVAGAWVVVRRAPRAPRGHALAFFVLALALDTIAVVQLGHGMPLWFSAGVLLTLPLQVWLGLRLALRGRADAATSA